MTLARPELLALLWLLPLALWVLWRGERRRRQRLALVIGRNAAASGVDLRPARTVVKVTLLILTLAVLIIALARPRWGFAWTDVKRHGSDIIIAVDVSQSMLAQDVNPSRIERAKHEILDLLPVLKGDRIGLVAFAGDAFVECPLTEDYAAMRMFVGFLGPDLIPLQGTDLKGAINTSMKALFDGSPGGTEGRAIILITDGEDQEPDAEKAAAAAKDKGVKIYALGIGTPDGAPIPDPNGGFKKDAAGNMVVTRPNEKALSRLAASSGGVFARSEAAGGDLERIYVSGIRQQVAQREYQATREKLWFERFQWFVGLAILLLVAEFCLHDVRLTALLLVGLGLSASAPPALAGSLAEVYNQSVERYRKGDFAAAARGFAAAGDSTDQVLAETSLFNLGNTQVQLGKLDEAIKAYENALALDPKDQQARENLEYVKKLKDQQDKQKDQSKTDHNQNNPDQQQQNNQPPPQGQQNQSNKQDPQNQNQNQQNQQKNQQDQNQSNKQDPQNQQPQGGQPEQKPQDQNKEENKDQKGGSDQDPSKKDPSKDKPEQQPSGGDQGQDKDKNKDEKDKGQDKQPEKDGDQRPQDEGPGGAGQGGADQQDQQDKQDKQDKQDQKQSNRGAQGELQPQQMSPEEAEKVLRAVDDNPKKFLYAPKDKNPPRHKDKDW